MRISRTYIAGLGATGVLVASSVILLVVVSTFVAFQGWSHGGLADDVGSLVVKGDDGGVTLSGPQQVAAAGGDAAGTVTGAPVTRTPIGAGGADLASAPGGAGSTPGLEGGAPGGGGFDLPPGGSPPQLGGGSPVGGGLTPVGGGGVNLPPTSPPRTPGVGPTLTLGVGNTTTGLTNGIGTEIGRINQPVGQTVQNAGQTVGGIINGVGHLRLQVQPGIQVAP